MDAKQNPYYVSLPGRGLIHLEGADRHDFLQGLITNDIRKLSPGKVLYSALLTPQGKFLHDFFIHDSGDALLLDCEDGARAKDLYARLLQYRLRKNIQISVEEDNAVYAVFGTAEGLPDPRHADMGRRTFEKPEMEERAFDAWDTLRIERCIPDGSRDLKVELSTLHEGRIDTLNGIDWNKGCYVGQELTARMHHRGLAKRHLYTVYGFNALPAPFTELADGGEMRSSCGLVGLALLKDDTAQNWKDGNGQVRLLG